MTALSSSQQLAYQQLSECYQQLQQSHSNVVWELLKNEPDVTQWHHYPKHDVKDKKNHSQYYYHSHPSQDDDRVPEHGHFHLFLMKSIFSSQLEPLVISEKHRQDASKDGLCHLVAIAMNDKGIPAALFTVNHWVVQGVWYKAEEICRVLDQFIIATDKPSILTNRWINAMVQLFKGPIQQLLYTRDEVIENWAIENPSTNVYTDKQLEVTSICRL